MVKKNVEDMYNRLDSIPACDRQTDRNLATAQSAMHTRRGKNRSLLYFLFS